jgi:ACS family hexuronate transporter-like MFS transporter
MFIGWSAAGVATAWSLELGQQILDLFPGLVSESASSSPSQLQSQAAYVGLLTCRVVLGFFESGHWPCALITTQRLLAANDRPLGNSVLQSGASIGAILAPPIVIAMASSEAGGWRSPFVVVGVAGMLWVPLWLLVVRGRDLSRPSHLGAHSDKASADATDWPVAIRRYLVLLAVVIPINMTWQFFRAWLPKMLIDQHEYEEAFVAWFSSGYFVMADVGCLAVGFAVKGLTEAGWTVQRARLATFAVCTGLCMLSALAAFLPAGPLLLITLLLIGFGALGLFPTYYSLAQDISYKNQGLVGGSLGFTTWILTSIMHRYVGKNIDETGSYATGLLVAGQVPIIACLALALFWGVSRGESEATAK